MASQADPRVLALRVLRRVEEDAAFANLALDAELAAAGKLDPRDAGLATELVYGVLRRRGALDRALTPLVKGGLAKLEPSVLDVLRLGAHQLLHLGTPAHAAVGETVEAAKAAGLVRAAGLVNAVLRRLSREGAPPPPDRTQDPIGALEVAGSLPRWLAEALLARLPGNEPFEFAEACDAAAPPTLRVNTSRTSVEELIARLAEEVPSATVRRGAFAPGALTVEGAGSLARLPAFLEGFCSLQDEAAQLVGHLVAPARGDRILDACAAPGGKACHLAELGAAEVVAVDIHARKAARIAAEAARLGLGGVVRTLAADAGLPLPPEAGGPFDKVLVDAPCSGTGTLRRHPEVRYRRTQEDLVMLGATQAKILDAVAPLVRPGGILVYAVCAVTAEEGPLQVDAFLARQLGAFAPAPLVPAPAWSEEGHRLVTWPHRGGLDGFFAARLVRAR